MTQNRRGVTALSAGPVPAKPVEEFRIPVEGGTLAVLRWPAAEPQSPVVLALHGITANALSWARVAHHLAGRATLLAPDLRGRAGSSTLPGPYGIEQHVKDISALLDTVEAASLVLAGHSMGAFVAAATAVCLPGRFSSVLLVDGGLGFPTPLDLEPDELITAVIGPAMQRLSMTFPDRRAYSAFWQAHPAFARAWEPWVDAYVQRDLVGEEPQLRSSCTIEAVRADGIGQFAEAVLSAVRRLPCPARLLWAERGLMDEAQGLYDEQRLAAAGLDPQRVTTHMMTGSNHYTVLIGDSGARTTAQHLLAMASSAHSSARNSPPA